MPRKSRRQSRAESTSPETVGGDEKPRQPATNLPPKAVFDALSEHVRVSVVADALFTPVQQRVLGLPFGQSDRAPTAAQG